MRCSKNDAETTFDFIFNPTNYGRVTVRCEDESGEKAGLYVEDKRVCGANLLYRHLTGDWTRPMTRRLSQQLRTVAGSNWEHEFGTRDYTTDYRGDRVKLTWSSEGNRDVYRLYINGINIRGNWRKLALHVFSAVHLHQMSSAAWGKIEAQKRLQRRR
jgi:hypothetical protein